MFRHHPVATLAMSTQNVLWWVRWVHQDSDRDFTVFVLCRGASYTARKGCGKLTSWASIKCATSVARYDRETVPVKSPDLNKSRASTSMFIARLQEFQ